jgi:hypothetical protein
VRSGSFRCPQHSPEIVWVLDPIKEEHKRWLVSIVGSPQYIRWVSVGFCTRECHDPLVPTGWDQPIQSLAGLDMDRHAASPGQLNHVLELPSRMNHKQPTDRALTRPQRFFDGMQAKDQLARLTASSGWCRRAGLRG